jgi:hypothetical protein
MNLHNKNRKFDKIFVWIQECIILLACFFYLYLYVHPVLILEALPPVFLLDANFFNGFLQIPGGMIDWFSAFIMQFWFSDFVIALFLTFCFWIITYLTRKWIETQMEGRPIHTIHLLPAGLLLVLQSQYYFPFSITMALIINLTILNLFIRWAPKQQALRMALGLIVSVFLFWVTGGAFLIFMILCGVSDLFYRKQIANGLLLFILSPVLPYAASATIFLVPLKEAYLHNLVFEIVTNYWINAYILPVLFLVILIIISLAKIPVLQKLFGKVSKLALIWKCAVGTLLLTGATLLWGQKSYNRTAQFILQLNRDVKENQWMGVLELANHWPSVKPLFSFQTNIACYQSGILLDRMFAYPQPLGTLGLLMDFDWCSASPEPTSNFYWMLGLITESQHWTHEAFEQKGYTPGLLKRLGMIYMLKGDNEAAKKYFLNLKNVPFHEKTTEDLLRLNENPSALAQDPEVNYIRSLMPVNNIALTGNSSLLQLEILLNRNPKNKMAFEYMIAYHLLTGNLLELMNHIPDFKALGYTQLPVHVQEAMLVVASQTPNFNVNMLYSMVFRNTYERFVAYQQILQKFQGNISAAKQELQNQFGDTYWFYLMYVRPGSRPPEEQHEYPH